LCKKFSSLKFPLSEAEKKSYFKEEPVQEGSYLHGVQLGTEAENFPAPPEWLWVLPSLTSSG
jgi:hypothetical protein